MSQQGKEHTMKRTALILGVAAAMGVFGSAAVGSTGQSEELAAVKPGIKPLPVLHTRYDGIRIMYRFGNTGSLME
jgi:hypothetical protein